LSRTYKIHEFAKLAGVTVRALHHYDRLGLLRPQRTESGYRAYQERDLETLEQIVALKFLGIPLKQIGAVLNRAAELSTALRLQRAAVEERHELLGRTIQAIHAAEESLASGTPTGAAILRTIIEVIEMQDGVAMMKKYYNDEAWERHRRYYEEGSSPEWRELYREGQALLGTDPSSSAAQSLTERWLDLSRRAHSGDPNAMTDSPEAWMDRATWPPAMKERLDRAQSGGSHHVSEIRHARRQQGGAR
jgi:DNA-binding transcriptional MerR regulator